MTWCSALSKVYLWTDINIGGCDAFSHNELSLRVCTRQSRIDIVQAAQTVVHGTPSEAYTVEQGKRSIASQIHRRVESEEPLVVEKVATLYTSKDSAADDGPLLLQEH